MLLPVGPSQTVLRIQLDQKESRSTRSLFGLYFINQTILLGTG